jgi:hypothetical protein
MDHAVELVVDLVHGRELLRLGAALGGEARRGALEDPAQLDGVVDVGPGEAAHGVAAGREALEQTLVLEDRQRHPHRRAGHAEALDQR